MPVATPARMDWQKIWVLLWDGGLLAAGTHDEVMDRQTWIFCTKSCVEFLLKVLEQSPNKCKTESNKQKQIESNAKFAKNANSHLTMLCATAISDYRSVWSLANGNWTRFRSCNWRFIRANPWSPSSRSSTAKAKSSCWSGIRVLQQRGGSAVHVYIA